MSRTLLPEFGVGTISLFAVWYLFPSVMWAQSNLSRTLPVDTNMSLIISGFVLTLGVYLLLGVYCYAIIAERVGYYIYEAIEEYLQYRRRDYL
jgi:hypothetical protein